MRLSAAMSEVRFPFREEDYSKAQPTVPPLRRYLIRCDLEGTGAVCGRLASFALASQIMAGALHLVQQVIHEL